MKPTIDLLPADTKSFRMPVDKGFRINETVVYFLVYGGEVIYIGASTNFTSRLLTHSRAAARYASLAFDSVAYMVVDRNQRFEIEKAWIVKLKPKLNGHKNRIETGPNRRRLHLRLEPKHLVKLNRMQKATGAGLSELVRRLIEESKRCSH